MSDNLDKVISRIQKLQKLSTSSNVHEASAAAAEAQRLMTEHRISEVSIATDASIADETVTEVEILRDTGTRTPRSWIVQLASGISRANGCRITIMQGSHNGSRGKIDLYGRKSDIDSARYLFMLMKNEIDRLALTWKVNTDGQYGRAGIFSFKLGAAVEISERMRNAKADRDREAKLAHLAGTATSADNALITLNSLERKVEEYVKGITNGKTRTLSGPSAFGAYQDGKQAGSRVNLGSGHKSLGEPNKLLK